MCRLTPMSRGFRDSQAELGPPADAPRLAPALLHPSSIGQEVPLGDFRRPPPRPAPRRRAVSFLPPANPSRAALLAEGSARCRRGANAGQFVAKLAPEWPALLARKKPDPIFENELRGYQLAMLDD